MILAIRSDKPQTELYLLEVDGGIAGKYKWEANRTLADTLITKINQFLKANHVRKSDLTGLVVFTGQGSFTGLRIGTTVANALAYALNIPVIKLSGDDWLEKISTAIKEALSGQYVVPDYDGEPNITRLK